MTHQEPMAALLAHLQEAPTYPIPPGLRAALLVWLRRSRAERDRLLNELADYLDPGGELGRWGRSQEVARQIQRFNRPENGARTGRREPSSRIEELLVEADRCGCGLPTSPRRVWDAMDDGLSKITG